MGVWNFLGTTFGLVGSTARKAWSYFAGNSNFSGEPVNPETVMQLATAWRCILLTSETIASLPVRLVRRDGGGDAGPLESINPIISATPNADMDNHDYWAAMQGARELVGNGWSVKHRRRDGTLVALELIDQTRLRWTKLVSGAYEFRYTDARGRDKIYSFDDLFHLKGFSFDGQFGLSTVYYGAGTFGASRAADKTASKVWNSGLSSSGFLQTNQVLNEPDRDRLQKVMDQYVGSDNVGKLMILEGGMEYKSLSMSATDAQLLLSRKWNVEEICRWWGIPPVLVGHNADGATMWGTGVEQVMLAWLTLGLRSRIRKNETAMERQLLTPGERATYRVKYNLQALLQGDSTAQSNFLKSLVDTGIIDRDEARGKLDMPARGGPSAEQMAQINIAPLNQLGQNSGEAQAREALRSWLGIEGPKNEPPKLLEPPRVPDKV